MVHYNTVELLGEVVDEDSPGSISVESASDKVRISQR